MLIIRLVFEAIMMVFKTSQETAVFVQVYRSSRPELFCKYGVPRNFVKLTGKHLCQSLFFNKGLRPATLLKKRVWHRCFPVNFCKISKNSPSYRAPPVAASGISRHGATK